MSAGQHGDVQRDQLADFLRRRRAAIPPAEVGIVDGPRRRTAGLRREEVAMLAGMSVDYVVRLEQGRSSRPSTQLLGALARALRLSEDERDHLFHLAGHPPAARRRGPPGWPAPACCACSTCSATPRPWCCPTWARSWPRTGPSVLLTGDQTGFTGDRRYVALPLVHRPGPPAPSTCPRSRSSHARQLVADLRATAGRRPGDPVVAGLVERLRAASADFRRLWAEHEVAVRRADRKTMVHPRVGPRA